MKSLVTVLLVSGAFDVVSSWLNKLHTLPTYEHGAGSLASARLIPLNSGAQDRYIVCGSHRITRIPANPVNSSNLAQIRAAHHNNQTVLKKIQADNIAQLKPLILIAGILLEDAGELVMQYFYVDKYHTRKRAIVVINATIMAFVSSVMLLALLTKIG